MLPLTPQRHFSNFGDPTGTRTPVSGLKVQRPQPLDDRVVHVSFLWPVDWGLTRNRKLQITNPIWWSDRDSNPGFDDANVACSRYHHRPTFTSDWLRKEESN